MAVCGGIVLEDSLDLSFDRLLMMMMMMMMHGYNALKIIYLLETS